VAAHAHAAEGIAQAVAAGVDTIEHCSWADRDGEIGPPSEALFAEMAARGQTVVSAGPLSGDMLTWFESGELPDTYRVRRQLALWRNARAAARAGVTVALATDSVFGAVADARDLDYRVRALTGLLDWPAVDVLEMVTGNAALALGRGDLGVLVEGAAADVAVFPGDLTRTPGHRPDPLAVWKGGLPLSSNLLDRKVHRP
jgi:imidazolonepropionase-like amidohydrolase